MKAAFRNVLIMLAYVYKGWQPHFDRALGVVALRRVKKRGANCLFEGDGRIIDPDRMEIGDQVYLGRNFFVRASGGVSIGSNTHISRNVTIHTVNHNMAGDMLPYDRTDIAKPIVIGRFVWVGMNCSILPGVKIGDGAVVGMNSVITKDVAPGSIVVGASQRVVGHRDDEATAELVKQGKFLMITNGWAAHG